MANSSNGEVQQRLQEELPGPSSSSLQNSQASSILIQPENFETPPVTKQSPAREMGVSGQYQVEKTASLNWLFNPNVWLLNSFSLQPLPVGQYHQARERTHPPGGLSTLDVQPPVFIQTRARNIAPPRQYQPPATISQGLRQEPTVSVRALSTGVVSVQPLRHILGDLSTRRPVVIITRRVTTPSGEVFNQRLTRPIQPPAEYVRVLRRLAQSDQKIPKK